MLVAPPPDDGAADDVAAVAAGADDTGSDETEVPGADDPAVGVDPPAPLEHPMRVIEMRQTIAVDAFCWMVNTKELYGNWLPVGLTIPQGV